MNKWLSLLLKIHIHPLFWLIAAIAIVTARFQELMILFFIVFIHELGHAVAASFFSWRIKSVVLLPFGGVAEFDEHGNRPLKQEWIVVLAGPLQHVWMMLLSWILASLSIISVSTHQQIIEFNMMILLFNCLPILPLDGGKLVYLYLSKKLPFSIAQKRAIFISVVFLVLYCMAIIFITPFHLNGWLIAIFLLVSIYKEWKNRPYVFMRFLIERYSDKKQAFVKTQVITATKSDSLHAIIHQFKRGTRHSIVIQENGKAINQIKEDTLLKAYFEDHQRPETINDLLSVI